MAIKIAPCFTRATSRCGLDAASFMLATEHFIWRVASPGTNKNRAASAC